MTKVQEQCTIMVYSENDRIRLRILRSDLADATNPKMLEKYPHLGNPDNIAQLKAAIKRLETYA